MLPSLTWSLWRGGACHRTLTLHQRSSPFSPPGPHLLPGDQTVTNLKKLHLSLGHVILLANGSLGLSLVVITSLMLRLLLHSFVSPTGTKNWSLSKTGSLSKNRELKQNIRNSLGMKLVITDSFHLFVT